MSIRKRAASRRTRLSIEPLEPRRLLDVSGVWQELGFRGASGGGITYTGVGRYAEELVTALTPDGNSVVAYEIQQGIQVRMFDGLAWQLLTNGPTEVVIPHSNNARNPDVAVDSQGNIYVSWLRGYDSSSEVFMSRYAFDPTTGQRQWEGLANSDVGGGVSSDGVVNGIPAIAVGIDDAPVMAYAAQDTYAGAVDMDVVAKKYVEELDRWVELTSGTDFLHGGGGVSKDDLASAGWPGSPQAVDIAIGGDNAPIVVWSSAINPSQAAEIYARRWNQVTGKWEKIGGDSASDPNDYPPASGLSNTTGNSIDPLIQIRQDPNDPNEDIVMVAWRDHDNLDDPDYAAVYVKQLVDPTPETGSWAEITPGSASGDGIVGRGRQRDMSLIIGQDGLPLIGLTRLQVAPEDYVIDTTAPYSQVYVVNSSSGVEASNWYAWALDAEAGSSGVEWSWVGPEPDGIAASYSVTQARGTGIVELPDGSPLLLFGENMWDGDTWETAGPAGWRGGPYDYGSYPWESGDCEVYALRWDSGKQAWVNYGEGSGDFGGIDNDVRWNSDPVLATAGDGRILVAYAERVERDIYVRVRYYDDETGGWDDFGQDLLVATLSDAEVDNHAYRWDEVVIASDPSVGSGGSGRPMLAYLDYINTTNPGDASTYEHSTITAWSYNESSGQWGELLGSTGGYAYVTPDGQMPDGTPVPGTVWNGWLIDQIEIIAAPDNTAYLAWRLTDPTGEQDDSVKDTLAHIEDVLDGGREPYNSSHGRSDICALKWDNTAGAWVEFGGGINPFVGMSWNAGFNFDPSLLLTPDGHVWLAFATAGISDEGLLLSNVQVWEYSTAYGVWRTRTSGLPAPSGTGESYAHPQLALGSDQRPVLAWEQQTWTLRTLQDLGVLGAWNPYLSNNPNNRPFWADDDGELPQWRMVLPEAYDYDEPMNDENDTFADAQVVAATEIHTSISGEIRDIHAVWDTTHHKWVNKQDKDFYQVRGLPPGALVLVSVTGVTGELRPTLKGYDQYGTEVAALTAEEEYELPVNLQDFALRADASGRAYFSIQGEEGDTGGYVVEVSPTYESLGPGEYTEDEGVDRNDSFGQKDTVTPGYVRVTGSLDSGMDVDYFEVPNLPYVSGEAVEYEIEIIETPDWDAYLGEVSWPMGTITNYSDDVLTVEVASSGCIYFAVSGAYDIEFDGLTEHEYGDYVIEIRPANPPETFAESGAYNDTAGAAEPFTSPHLQIDGELPEGAGDQDFYRIKGLTPYGIYTVEVDFLVAAWDPEASSPAPLPIAPSGTLTLCASEDGELLLRVFGGEGTYSLKVTPLEEMPAAEEFEEEYFYDDNDDYAKRNVMPPPSAWSVIHGSLIGEDGETAETSDFYEVRLPYFDEHYYPDGGWVDIMLTSRTGDLDARLRYFHDDGNGAPDEKDVTANGEHKKEYWLEVQSEIDADTNELVVRFEVFWVEGKGDYTVEVKYIVDAFVAEDAFQELTSSSIVTARYNGSGWTQTGDFTPPSGYAYVLPEMASATGYEPYLTYTSLELDGAGFTTSTLKQWKLDLGSGTWSQHAYREKVYAWYNVDLGLRSYFNGDYGREGDGSTSFGASSDLVASYFNPRIMYGSRHMDFEFVWWRNLAGYGKPSAWYAISEQDETGGLYLNGNIEGGVTTPCAWGPDFIYNDYRTPLPGDSETNGSRLGYRADGHVSGTSTIHAWRYNGLAWEQINSQDVAGSTLPSGEDLGLNAMGGGWAWSPGFISSVGVRGSGEGLFDAQPVVAWNYAEQSLIHVRQWAPEYKLPELEVTETSGTPNDNRLSFGTRLTGQSTYQTVVLKNTGNTELTVWAAAADGTWVFGSDAFTVTDINNNTLSGSIVIEANHSKIIRVHFNATQAGLHEGTLYIANNDPLVNPLGNNWYTMSLTGSAYSGAQISVSEDAGTADDLAVPFGLATVGQTTTRTVTISNDGTAALNVRLSLHGVGEGFRIVGDRNLTIAAGQSAEVEVLFEGDSANQQGAVGYLTVYHDACGSASSFEEAEPILVQLIGNTPSVSDPVEIGFGANPSVALGTAAYSTTSGNVRLYEEDQGGTLTSISDSGAGRARSDGRFTVYALGGEVRVYDRMTGITINLSGAAGLSNAQNPSISGTRVVFSASSGSDRDIFVVDLNVRADGSINQSLPVADQTHIVDVNPSGRQVDDYADVSGDWVVWRRGSSTSGYTVYGMDLGTNDVMELSVGAVDGPRIPHVSGDLAVWVEHFGGSRVVLYEKDQSASTLLVLQSDISDEVAISGRLLLWSDNRNGNYDVFGYFVPPDGGGSVSGVDVAGRTFQLTFSDSDEVNPDVWGNLVAWQIGQGYGTIVYSGLEAGDPDIHLATSLPLDFGDVWVDVDHDESYYATAYLEITNTGTGILTIDEILGGITTPLPPNAELLLPTGVTLHQGMTALLPITLRVTAGGALDGWLEIHNNDPDPLQSVLPATFVAEGVEPAPVVTGSPTGTTISSLDFGTVQAGSE
ncbi:MAG: choice-of-anchor D domain-containing protein, partial [Phycisphaerae bacterium]|nr:choice-of-anchor D domain-containing protein [Phycisphaerae bacterium]